MSARRRTTRNACATCEFWNGTHVGTTSRADTELKTATLGANPCAVGFFDQFQRFSDDDCPQWRKWNGSAD